MNIENNMTMNVLLEQIELLNQHCDIETKLLSAVSYEKNSSRVTKLPRMDLQCK